MTVAAPAIYLPPMRRSLSLITAALFLTGCSEAYVIRSYPDSVRMSVNEQYVGITPVVVPLKRSEMRPYRWTAEKEGYETQEGTMKPRIGVGRIFGYIFTVGLLAIFKGPQYMPDLMVDMKPLPKTTSAAPAEGPSSVTVSAPRDSARRSTSTRARSSIRGARMNVAISTKRAISPESTGSSNRSPTCASFRRPGRDGTVVRGIVGPTGGRAATLRRAGRGAAW